MSPPNPRLRRMQWKLGRRLCMQARGEPRSNLPDRSDERHVQQSDLAATGALGRLVMLDFGANTHPRSSRFLRLASGVRRRLSRLALTDT